MNRLFLLLVSLVTIGLSARAELPPSAYEKMQHAAPEVLRIQVLQVSVQPDGDTARDVTMLAEVLKVGRSHTSLKANDMVTIKYKLTTHPAGWVGPGDVPVLKENTETVAYLAKDANSDNYAPAAGAMSFDQF
jgi:hypothetical protein